MDASEIVEQILQKSQSEVSLKSTEVHRDIDVDLDLGNLVATDPNPVDACPLRSQHDQYLLQFARDDIQILVNELWKLPVEVSDNVHVVKLPAPKTVVPREKPVPAAKRSTRWEEYARLKGLTKRKRGRMVWDEQAKEWRPRWGYKRANDNTNDWCIEVPVQADPMEDQFAKRVKAKKEAVAKNELQRLRNIARNMKGKVPGVGLTPVDKPDKDHVSTALTMARSSTASLGKFDKSLPKEKSDSHSGRKRKFEANFDSLRSEKQRSLDILHRLSSGQPLLDANKVANQLVASQQMKRADERKVRGTTNKPRGGKKRGGGKRSTHSAASKKQQRVQGKTRKR